MIDKFSPDLFQFSLIISPNTGYNPISKLTHMFKYSKDGITVGVMLDTRKISAQDNYPVRIRVNQKRIRQYYPTGHSLTKEEWLKLSEAKSKQMTAIRESIENSFNLVRSHVEALAEKGDFSFDILNTRLGRTSKSFGYTVNSILEAKIEQFKQEDRIGTMEIYRHTLRNLEDFSSHNGNKIITFDSITVPWLKKCEAFWLKTKNYTTIGILFRNLRTIMNEARRSGLIKESHYPFGKDKFEIKSGLAEKRALTLDQIGKIFNYSDGTALTNKYRDLWMFVYMCNGINVADLVRLKFSDMHEGEISFIRQKTERTSKTVKKIRAVVTPEMDSIIAKWGNKNSNSEYIFPFLDGSETAIRRKEIVKSLTKRINLRMKGVAKALGFPEAISKNISTYTARHSFATVLKRSGANIAYISESLGHNDLRTTEHYLAEFEKEERTKNSLLLMNF